MVRWECWWGGRTQRTLLIRSDASPPVPPAPPWLRARTPHADDFTAIGGSAVKEMFTGRPGSRRSLHVPSGSWKSRVTEEERCRVAQNAAERRASRQASPSPHFVWARSPSAHPF
ncbi:hypothetical protein AAFF_G00100840 [Aldrovandia affinis]|uniref:Uncharacterized protein n=1 Tax=Aldrovandia affinis TaxID=143900 RepID=A0AAD7WCC6_9TELE|nr:hypothetical protein AAFF_G00100840 [Aldrovandia affinis]